MKRIKNRTAKKQVHGRVDEEAARRLAILRIARDESVGVILGKAIDLLWQQEQEAVREFWEED